MTENRDLSTLVGFAVDPDHDGDVYMWTDHAASVSWTVTMRSTWTGISAQEVSPRREHMLLELTEYVVADGETPGLAHAGYISPLSAWFVGRESVVGVDIDFGDGTCANCP